MTLLQILNQVLRRLREDTVTDSTESTYSTLITEFILDALDIVQRAHEWTALDATAVVNTSEGIFRYSLQGAGDKFRVHSVWNDTDDQWLKGWQSDKLTKYLNSNDPSQECPNYYGFNGFDNDGDPFVDLYPVPDGTSRTINFNLNVPQYRENISDGTEILVPWLPVVLLAWGLAIDERGEDGGRTLTSATALGMRMLSDEIAIDQARSGREMIMQVQ